MLLDNKRNGPFWLAARCEAPSPVLQAVTKRRFILVSGGGTLGSRAGSLGQGWRFWWPGRLKSHQLPWRRANKPLTISV
jgi:hypothetical protein